MKKSTYIWLLRFFILLLNYRSPQFFFSHQNVDLFEMHFLTKQFSLNWICNALEQVDYMNIQVPLRDESFEWQWKPNETTDVAFNFKISVWCILPGNANIINTYIAFLLVIFHNFLRLNQLNVHTKRSHRNGVQRLLFRFKMET